MIYSIDRTAPAEQKRKIRAALFVKRLGAKQRRDELTTMQRLALVDECMWPILWPRANEILQTVDRIIDHCQTGEINIIVYGDREYPREFTFLSQPPPVLFVKGNMAKSEQLLSVVGSRKMSSCTHAWLNRELTSWLESGPDKMTASGGAPGVDSEVHRISLFCSRKTFVFLPCGFHFNSPWRQWEQRMSDSQGTIISEYFPLTPIRRGHFHQRNRLIAAFGKSLLVAQAALKSGSMMTANLALNLGRELAVVPGHPEHTGFSGSLKLAQEGAQIAIGSGDIELIMRGVDC